MSKGSEQLLLILREIYPNQTIELEHNIADKGALFIDIFIPHLGIGWEYDGVQHTKFNKHFHQDKNAFARARKRDLEKDKICKEKNIILIRISYNEDLTKELVLQKLEETLNG